MEEKLQSRLAQTLGERDKPIRVGVKDAAVFRGGADCGRGRLMSRR
jgi:hypothetical protein